MPSPRRGSYLPEPGSFVAAEVKVPANIGYELALGVIEVPQNATCEDVAAGCQGGGSSSSESLGDVFPSSLLSSARSRRLSRERLGNRSMRVAPPRKRGPLPPSSVASGPVREAVVPPWSGGVPCCLTIGAKGTCSATKAWIGMTHMK